MDIKNDLEVFLNPKSVAVIGATERPGSWGSFLMQGLLSKNYSGKIYPINRRGNHIFGLHAFSDVNEVPEPIDLATRRARPMPEPLSSYASSSVFPPAVGRSSIWP